MARYEFMIVSVFLIVCFFIILFVAAFLYRYYETTSFVNKYCVEHGVKEACEILGKKCGVLDDKAF